MSKGKDLFELLQLRSKGGAPIVARRTPPESDFVAKAKGWLQDKLAPAQAGRKKAAAGAKGAPVGVTIPGPWLAALLVSLLGVGFLLGRGTAGATAPEDLRASHQGREPGALPGGAPPLVGDAGLDLRDEEKALHKYFHLVLHFPASQRVMASELARHLRREHSLVTARIRLLPKLVGGEDRWGTLLYVPAFEDGPSYLERLEAVSPPDFVRNRSLSALAQKHELFKTPEDWF